MRLAFDLSGDWESLIAPSSKVLLPMRKISPHRLGEVFDAAARPSFLEDGVSDGALGESAELQRAASSEKRKEFEGLFGTWTGA